MGSQPSKAVQFARDLQVRQSGRRRRTAVAFVHDGRPVVVVPARLPARDRERMVADLLSRLVRREEQRDRELGEGLLARAYRLSAKHLDGVAVPTSVTWSDRQQRRWGSCSPASGRIRMSSRLRELPDFVIDHVLLHELAHLIEPGHGPRFRALLAGFPRAERAEGFLEGFAAAERRAAVEPAG